jgi:hypothetical protein
VSEYTDDEYRAFRRGLERYTEERMRGPVRWVLYTFFGDVYVTIDREEPTDAVLDSYERLPHRLPPLQE